MILDKALGIPLSNSTGDPQAEHMLLYLNLYRREGRENRIDERTHFSQRMIGGNAVFIGDIRPHRAFTIFADSHTCRVPQSRRRRDQHSAAWHQHDFLVSLG